MLTSLRVKNYKSFRSSAILPLRRITVLLGKNNSGKTAAARLPLLLLTALAGSPTLPSGPLPLRIRDLNYGSSMLELIHRQDPHGSFELGIDFRAEDEHSFEVTFEVQHYQSLDGSGAFMAAFQALPDIHQVRWTGKPIPHPPVTYDDKQVINFAGALPLYRDHRNKSIGKL